MGKGWPRILAGAVMGLFIGLGLFGLSRLPPQWQKLPPTASAVTEISTERLGGCSGALYVRTADGSLLQLAGLNGDVH